MITINPIHTESLLNQKDLRLLKIKKIDFLKLKNKKFKYKLLNNKSVKNLM